MGEDIEEALDRISRVRLFAGYAGWGEGQLDGELDEEAWFTEPALPGDVFSDDSTDALEQGAAAKGRPLPAGRVDAGGSQPQLTCSK